MRTIEAIPVVDYSRDEAILILSRLRAKFKCRPISVPTFYRWLGELGITPKWRYSDEDLKRLSTVCVHYSQGGKTANLPEV